MKRTTPFRTRGFTLLELMVVLALVSMILALAWPSLESMFESGKLPSAAQQVRTVLREARRLALQRGVVYRVEVDLQGSNIRATAEVDPATQQTAPTGVSEDDPHESVDQTLPIGVTIAEVKPADEDDEKPLLGQPLAAVAQSTSNPVDAASATTTDVPDLATESDSQTPRWRFFARCYPDGSADEAKLILADAQNRRIEVQLSALAGSVEVGAVAEPVKTEPRS